MLIGTPTKYGAGMELMGDFWDLSNLHKTIHRIVSGSRMNQKVGDFILGLAYEIKYAYQGMREDRPMGTSVLDTVNYKGVKLLWPWLLFQTALLRWSASFQPTTKEDQADLYRLEHCVERSLIMYEPQIARECMQWLSSFPGVPDDYLFEYATEVGYQYVFGGGKVGKSRFKKLPDALYALTILNPSYKQFEWYIAGLARQKGCRVEDLVDLSLWPNFKW